MRVGERLRQSDARLGRAIARAVPDEDWVSDEDAADRLGLSLRRLRLGPLVAGPLRRATNSVGQRGVTRESLQAAAEWRRSASSADRVRRAAAVAVSWLVP